MPNNKKIISQIDVFLHNERDARILLTLWYMKRTFIPLILLGFIGSILATDLGNNEIEYTNPESVLSNLLSPLVSLAFAVFIKGLVNILAGLAAYPVVQERLRQISHIQYTNIFNRYLDMWRILKGIRSLRWTHHVRQEAANYLSIDFIKKGKLDTFIDIFNILLIISLFASLLFISV